jgi:ABC-type multidrug transport system ATPase subunit
VIRTHALTKRYGSTLAVDSIDLDVREGDVYGFLGANGSGKTTSVRCLLGLVLATSGEIELLGRPMPRAARDVLPHVGTLVEGPAAYGHLPAFANLDLLERSGPRRGSRSARRKRIGDVLEQVGLGGVGGKPVKAYSLGMRQRLGLAAALLGEPELLVLDEPTNGLDPQGIHEVRDLLLELNRNGTTVFLSSHLLGEIEQMCSRVGVLDRGRLVLQEPLAVLRAPTGRTVVTTPEPTAAVALLAGRVEERDGDRLVVRGGDPAAVNDLLVRGGIAVRELIAERNSLEQIVLERTSAGSDRVDVAGSAPRPAVVGSPDPAELESLEVERS